jgi:hypothetical protein
MFRIGNRYYGAKMAEIVSLLDSINAKTNAKVIGYLTELGVAMTDADTQRVRNTKVGDVYKRLCGFQTIAGVEMERHRGTTPSDGTYTDWSLWMKVSVAVMGSVREHVVASPVVAPVAAPVVAPVAAPVATGSSSTALPSGISVSSLKISLNLVKLEVTKAADVKKLFNDYRQNCEPQNVKKNEDQQVISLVFEDEQTLKEMIDDILKLQK